MSAKTSLQNVPGEIIWRMPLSFRIANSFGSKYTLRCVLFHDIADRPSAFTDGLGVTLSRQDFEARIRFLSKYYNPVGLQEILAAPEERKLPPRPVLVTFDDAYASVAVEAGPICQRYGIPAIFFVSASFVENQDLALDNLVCYVANTLGIETINRVAREVVYRKDLKLVSLRQLFNDFLPTLSLDSREEFRARLASDAGIRTTEVAREAQLYIGRDQLRSLVSSGFDIGNHTYSHVNCRILSGGDFDEEIYSNKRVLEAIVDRKVRAFSVPYGSSADLGRELVMHLRRSGHEAVFLVEGLPNTSETDFYQLYRVSVHARTDADFFGELEILPRFRSIRDRLLQKRAAPVQ